MLPQVPTSKRNGYQINIRHHTSYHPYYSSSPMTNNTVSHTGQNSVLISNGLTRRNEYEDENCLDTDQISNNSNNNSSNTPNKFNLFYSVNKSNSSDLDGDASSMSSMTPTTRPPTTPVSSTNCNNSLNQGEDLSASASPQLVRMDQASRIEEISSTNPSSIYTSTNSNSKNCILYVTPATNTSSASSSVSAAACFNRINDQDSDIQKPGSSSASSIYSSAHATYSRSSSMNSLNSFDIKSTHSSIPSEYSSMGTNPFNNLKNSEDMYSTKYQGCVTPTTYSELPSSPGELFPCNQQEQPDPNLIYLISSSVNGTNFNSVNNSAARNSNKPTSINEISVCTVDSNPSKSNDITIIERTVIGSHSHNNTHLGSSGGFGGSVGNTFIHNPDDENATTSGNHEQTNLDTYEEDNVISYDMEGSLWDAQSTRSNVSGLTFPSEPTADLAFIRNLLNKKSTPLSDKTKSVDASKLEELFKAIEKQDTIDDKKKSEQQPKRQHQWSNYSVKQFTPPVKLKLEDSMNRTNKKLFNDDEDYNDEIRSIASLPSDIALDRSTNIAVEKSNFSALFNKLDKSQYESSPSIDRPTLKTNFFTRITQPGLNNSPANFKDNIKEANYLKNFSIQKESEIQKSYENPQNEEDSYYINEEYNSYNEQHKDDSDSDEEFLNDFINEMLPKALGAQGEDEESVDVEEFQEKEEEVDEVDFDQEQQIQKYLAERNFYRSETEQVINRILPKIDEVDNENDDSRIDEDEPKPKTKRRSIEKSLQTHPASKSTIVNVHMTKTALLRESRIKSAQLNNNQNSANKSVVKTNANNKRALSRSLKNIENTDKKQNITSSSNYNQPTKSSVLKIQSTDALMSKKSTALRPSNKSNSLKNSRFLNSQSNFK